MIKLTMPTGARYIIEQLNNSGFEAYIVGGCVRDSLLGKNPNDWDITTSATPYEVKGIFKRTIDTGIQHGTVTVLVDKSISKGGEYSFEVTTYRVDGKYEDHRRPSEVLFTACLEEDLKRRDFTINAMAYNDEKGVIDIFGGVKDLDAGIIRCVGKASDRFDEDALRILRAERFAAQLGFVIDDETKKAMEEQAGFLKDISAERIQVELTKLITSNHPDRLVEAYELGLTKIILPEFDAMMETEQDNPHHLYNVGIHTIKVMENIEATPILRYTALLHDVAKPLTKSFDDEGVGHFYGHQEKGAKLARQILRRLKLDNNTIDKTCLLIEHHDYGLHGGNIKAFRRFLNKLGKENFQDFLAVKRADMAGQSDYNSEVRKGYVADMVAMFDKVEVENQCIKLSDMAINGKDLIELGVSPGKEMGAILKALFEKVLDDPGYNDKEKLKAMVEDIRLENISNREKQVEHM